MIIPIYNLALLPGMEYTLEVKKENRAELERAIKSEEKIVALPLKKKTGNSYLVSDFYKIGALIHVDEIVEQNDKLLINLDVESFAEVTKLTNYNNQLNAHIEVVNDQVDIDTIEQREMLSYIKKSANDTAKKMMNQDEIISIIDEFDNLNKLIGFITQGFQIEPSERYKLMETLSLKERTLVFIEYMRRFDEKLNIQIELAERVSEKANKNYRDAALREQLRIIQEKLDEGKPKSEKQNKDYRTRVEEADLPEEVKEVAFEEVGKFESMQPSSPEYNVVKNYLDLILSLPWKPDVLEQISITEARRVLNDQHYGLEKVKDRIIQHLAVMQLKEDKKGSIILLAGPPGTGKTSLGKSIAAALDREYVRLSLGGIRDEAQIRGHRRTYIGALPGRIIKAMKDAGTMNPVMVLDEVDKMMAGYSGDPASALLEVLDPEQNNTFNDNYLDIPYDLSNVLFIATANNIENIPQPLLDRMEVIRISSYTATEKFHIGKEHLIQKSMQEHGLSLDVMEIPDETLQMIIDNYTMEAGVRGLKKQLDTLSRITAEKVVTHKNEKPFVIEKELLSDMLGRKVSRHEKAQKITIPGVVTGLAWTPVGGEILFIEATDIPGKGNMTITGQLGDVMQESAKIALSLIKSRLPVNAVSFDERDIHIHVPSGAVPKDGPSAGVTLFTSLASLITGIPVSGKIAMTGEISLRGVVMPIGGLKEKLIAAQRAGITKALVPIDNVDDLKDIPQEVKDELEIVPVETVEDVLRETMNIQLPRVNAMSWLDEKNRNGYLLPN